MATERDKRLSESLMEGGGMGGKQASADERCAEVEQEALARVVFMLALTLATEPAKLGQLRQMLVRLQQQGETPEGFSAWAVKHIDERLRSMALEYAHDAEVLVQILSFKGGTRADLMQEIDELYRLGRLSERVYVKAKLLLRGEET